VDPYEGICEQSRYYPNPYCPAIVLGTIISVSDDPPAGFEKAALHLHLVSCYNKAAWWLLPMIVAEYLGIVQSLRTGLALKKLEYLAIDRRVRLLDLILDVASIKKIALFLKDMHHIFSLAEEDRRCDGTKGGPHNVARFLMTCCSPSEPPSSMNHIYYTIHPSSMFG